MDICQDNQETEIDLTLLKLLVRLSEGTVFIFALLHPLSPQLKIDQYISTIYLSPDLGHQTPTPAPGMICQHRGTNPYYKTIVRFCMRAPLKTIYCTQLNVILEEDRGGH